MDTAFLIDMIDNSDKYHEIATDCYKNLIRGKWLIITTDAILIEIGNGLSKLKWRQIAHQWIRMIQKSTGIFQVVPTTAIILNQAMELYGSRSDKEWGLTDCISFVVMSHYNLTTALTLDRHFEQAGFRVCLSL